MISACWDLCLTTATRGTPSENLKSLDSVVGLLGGHRLLLPVSGGSHSIRHLLLFGHIRSQHIHSVSWLWGGFLVAVTCLWVSRSFLPCVTPQLQNQSELRAPTAEKAAFFLDAAIASRRSSQRDCDEEDHRNSHMLFTLHIYQYRMEKSGKGGSKLTLRSLLFSLRLPGNWL